MEAPGFSPAKTDRQQLLALAMEIDNSRRIGAEGTRYGRFSLATSRFRFFARTNVFAPFASVAEHSSRSRNAKTIIVGAYPLFCPSENSQNYEW